MERTQRKRIANAILVSDLHLTETIPVSRTDDYVQAQRDKLIFLRKLSARNRYCPILCSGDIFDYWKASPWLCQMVSTYLPKPFICIPGQHDLPMHSLELYERSALSLIEYINNDYEEDGTDGVYVLGAPNSETSPRTTWETLEDSFSVTGIPFGALENFDPKEIHPTGKGRKILLLHELVWKGEPPSWNKNGWTDQKLLEQYGEYFDLILTGDNHDGFTSQKGDCLLVNPGSMLRMNADQEKYRPRCYLYYTEENEVIPAYFPVEQGVHNQKHLTQKKERDERIEAYIARMKSDWEVEASFRKNLEAFFMENKTPKKIKDVILWHLETEKI